MRGSRMRIAAIAATLIGLVAALFVGVNLTTAAAAKPDLETVKKQVDELDHEAEAASERYNDARVLLEETHQQLSALDADLKRQQKVVDTMRAQVARMVVDQYQGGALSTTSQVVLSDDPDAFLDNLNAVSAYNNQRGQVMSEYAAQLQRLRLRKTAVRAEERRVEKLTETMRVEKARIDDRAAKAQALLDELEAEARAKLLAGEWSGTVPDIDASGRAAVAIKYAMAQVGKAYVYGAAGPNSYDCSGLTMRAWGAAGVGLPHSSRAQTGSGRRVSEGELQPGDLVFYYSPVSHVGMYIGNGLIVNAQRPGLGVRVTGLHSMPYVGAVRVG